MPASTMLSGVAKSGSPISRWTIFLPSASSLRARASTSNAPSVPSRVMRSANLMLTLRMLRKDEVELEAGFIPAVTQRATFRAPPSKSLREGVSRGRPAFPAPLVDAAELPTVDANRLAGDEARLLRAQERARRAELGWVAHAPQRHGFRALPDVLFDVDPGRRQVADAVGQHRVRREAVDGDAVGADLLRQSLGHPGHRGADAVGQDQLRDRLAGAGRGDDDDAALI